VINHDPNGMIELQAGDRIAQLVIQRVARAQFELVDELPSSPRGAAGHGSTGGAAALLSPPSDIEGDDR
jgi:dUTP pyrophosphatase